MFAWKAGWATQVLLDPASDSLPTTWYDDGEEGGVGDVPQPSSREMRMLSLRPA